MNVAARAKHLRRTIFVGSARSSIFPVNYIFPQVANHPITLPKFLIVSGLLRLNFVHSRAVVQVQAQAPAANAARALLRQRSGPCALRRCCPCAAGPSASGRGRVPKPHWCVEAAVAGPSKAAPVGSAPSSASRWNSQRSGPHTLVQAQVAVIYAMYPKVAGRPKVLSKFSILTGLVRLILAHPIAVPLKGSSRSHSQVNLIAYISQAKYVAVPSGSGSPFLLFWGGYGPNLRFEKYTVSRVLFSLAALPLPDPDRTVVLGRWSEEIYRFNLQKAEGRPKGMSKIPFLTTFDSRTSRPPVAAPPPRHLPGGGAPRGA